MEVDGDRLKVWVTASPTDGQANDAVCSLVASSLGLAKSSVSVKRGFKSRDKVLEIQGLSRAEVFARSA